MSALFHVYSDCGATLHHLAAHADGGATTTITFLPLYDETPQSVEALATIFRGPDLDLLMHALSSLLCGADQALFHPARFAETILVTSAPAGDSPSLPSDDVLRHVRALAPCDDPESLHLAALLIDREIGFLFAPVRNRLAVRLYQGGRMIATTPVSSRPDRSHGYAICRALLDEERLTGPLSAIIAGAAPPG